MNKYSDKSETTSKPNQIDGIKVDIPSSIASLLGTTLVEQIALSRIVIYPCTTNGSLATLLGLSVRGVEAMLKRLRDHGFLSTEGVGRRRKFVVKFPVDQHKKCGDEKILNSHTKEVVQHPQSRLLRRESSTAEKILLRLALYDDCFEVGALDAARRHLEIIRELLEFDGDFSAAEHAKWAADLIIAENRCTAFKLGLQLAESLLPKQKRELALALCRATSEQLALLRRHVEASPLGLKSTVLIDLGVVGDHESLVPSASPT